MFALLVAITALKYPETLEGPIHMFDRNAVAGKIPVEALLQRRQLALARLLVGNRHKGVQGADALVALVGNK